MAEDLRIEHKPSKDFVSQVVTGTFLSGPTADGLLHFIFYRDAISVEYESGKPTSEERKYKVSVEPSGIKNFREDQARISMPESVLKTLADIISRHLKKMENAETGDPDKDS